MKFDFVWTQGVGIVQLSCRCFELSHLGHSCRFVLISDRPFPSQRQTSLNTDLHSMQITAVKLTRCDDREVKFEFCFDLGRLNFLAVLQTFELLATEDFVITTPPLVAQIKAVQLLVREVLKIIIQEHCKALKVLKSVGNHEEPLKTFNR